MRTISDLKLHLIAKTRSASSFNKLNRVRGDFLGLPAVAHHGIQRSGTNYLCYVLRKLGLNILNYHSPGRNHPQHKHFRWQENKSSISSFLSRDYHNDIVCRDVDELNFHAQYPDHVRHIVVKKNRDSWLVSALNYGLRTGWFSCKKVALTKIPELNQDYNNYYSFWENMESRFPRSVCVFGLEGMQSDFPCFVQSIEGMGLKCKNPDGFDGKVTEVPMSPGGRRNVIARADIEDWLTSNSAA